MIVIFSSGESLKHVYAMLTTTAAARRLIPTIFVLCLSAKSAE